MKLLVAQILAGKGKTRPGLTITRRKQREGSRPRTRPQRLGGYKGGSFVMPKCTNMNGARLVYKEAAKGLQRTQPRYRMLPY